MSMIDNYNEILESKRNNLVDFVCEQISRISMPVVDDNTSTESTVSHSNSLPLALIVGGSVVFVAGIAISKSVVTSLGGIVALGGVAMKFASSKKERTYQSQMPRSIIKLQIGYMHSYLIFRSICFLSGSKPQRSVRKISRTIYALSE